MKRQAVAEGDLALSFLRHLHRFDARSLASLMLSRRKDLTALGDFLVNERLGVYAHSAIHDLNLQTLLPRPVASLLRDQWEQQQQRNAELLEVLAQLDQAFREAGIDYLLLKGLYLSDRFYQGIDRRFTWDLDLLVRSADIQGALNLLDRLGFEKPKFTLGLDRIAPHVAHALECRRADGLSVDLHWAFRRLPGLHIDDEAIWQGRRFHAIGGQRYPVPSDEHTLLQLLLGVAADIDRSLCRMRALWDVYLLLKGIPEPDWPGFLARREAEGSMGLVVNALSLIFYRLSCHAEFPTLLEALQPYRRLVIIKNENEARRVFAREPHSLGNHFLFARWQPLTAWRYWSWWAATLPLRFFFARRI